MRIVLLSEDAPCKLRELFISAGIQPLSVPSHPRLDRRTAAHPDMLMTPLPAANAIVVCGEWARSEGAELLRTISSLSPELRVLYSDTRLYPEYPRDVAFNAAVCGNFVFARADTLSAEISASPLTVCDVRQGYAKCSSVTLSGAIITADRSISRAAAERGVDVLDITPGHVLLPGYNTGFIGGASAVSEDTVYFFGSLAGHPDAERIRRFLDAHGYSVLEADMPLTDLGSGFILRLNTTTTTHF